MTSWDISFVELPSSIAGNPGIDFGGPAIDASGHGFGGWHALVAEPVGHVEAAHTVVAEANDIFAGIELLKICRDCAHGDEQGAVNTAKSVFVRFADVNEQEFFAAVETRFDLTGRDFKIVHGRSSNK